MTNPAVLARRRAHYAANRERLRADAQRRRQENPEREREWDRARHARDRDKRNAATAAHRATLPAEELQRRRRASREKRLDYYRACEQAWRAAHPERMRDFRRTYKASHREQDADHAALRRARQRGLLYEQIDRAEVYARDDGWCYLCGLHVDPEVFHMDHVIPIVDGGPHLYTNVATTHAVCNQRKNRYPASRWGVAA